MFGVLLRLKWVCERCISSLVCIVFVLSVYISDGPSVCCVCGYIRLRFVYWFVTQVTGPNDWSVCNRTDDWLAQKQNGTPISWGREKWIHCVDVCSRPTSCRLCRFGPYISVHPSSTELHTSICVSPLCGYTLD